MVSSWVVWIDIRQNSGNLVFLTAFPRRALFGFYGFRWFDLVSVWFF